MYNHRFHFGYILASIWNYTESYKIINHQSQAHHSKRNKGLPRSLTGEPLAMSKYSAHPALQTKKRTGKATFASNVI